MKKLNNLYELENVKRDGFGLELLNSEPGAFIVHECSAYDEPAEIARYVHDGTALSRCAAYDRATGVARASQKYDGTQCDYNVYEEIEAPDGGLSALSSAELREVVRVANEIPKDIRRKQVTLRMLRLMEKADTRDNPYHVYPNPVTDRIWAPVFACIGSRLPATLEALADLSKRARSLLCPFNIGDRVVYAGMVCIVKTIRVDGVLVLDHGIEAIPEELTLAGIEPARNVTDMLAATIAENIQREANDPCSTKPTARGFLAAKFASQQGKLTKCDGDNLLAHLGDCCAYGVMNNQDYAALSAHVGRKKSGDYRPYLDALCACLVAGSDIANSLLSIAVI